MPLWMTGGRHVSPTAIPGFVEGKPVGNVSSA